MNIDGNNEGSHDCRKMTISMRAMNFLRITREVTNRKLSGEKGVSNSSVVNEIVEKHYASQDHENKTLFKRTSVLIQKIIRDIENNGNG
ncbi:hypothetical protein [Fundidesulfovibrio terrae]|uniref:hypothetical protein n=1 Tax=Fundidesulfovibrio terrae TaxID=2922866 RepID=UPI001FAFD001|nr:hypothetical protein [Fundidesulfovibrio terrae]